MGTISLTWNYKSSGSLYSCGVDMEFVERFGRLLSGSGNPLELAFTPEESSHNYSLDNPAKGFCACFCVKEALFKSIEEPYNYTDCQFFFSPSAKPRQIDLALSLSHKYNIRKAVAKLVFPSDNECVAGVYLYR